MNFWSDLPKPFFALALMDNVTDVVFRQVISAATPPDVFFTEFVATDGLQSAGRDSTLARLRLDPSSSTPVIVQIWGNNPEHYYRSAQELATLGFAGIDINLGCPDRSIVARGCCGGLIGRYDRVAELIAAVKAGAPDLPISVKTRIGLNRIITEKWVSFLLEQNLAALTIHGRTVREMSRIPARWTEIAKAAALRDQLSPHTIIIGNGDVLSRQQGLELAASTSVDGIMIGRGIFHDPFIFETAPKAHSQRERQDLLLKHLDLHERSGTKPYNTLKRFFKIYISNFPDAVDLRVRLMETTTPDEARQLLHSFPQV